MNSEVFFVSLRDIGYKYGLIKRIIYSVISLLKMVFALEGEVLKVVAVIEPFFMKVFDFIAAHSNIVIFVGVITLLTGAFTYFIFPVGETACLLATAIGFVLAPRITDGFANLVANGATTWDAALKVAPWVFWICLPTIFVGAICVCKRVKKWGGLTKTLLIGGLITLIAGVLLGLVAYLCYGLSVGANPAKTCMLISIILVTVAEQIVIFQKDAAEA